MKAFFIFLTICFTAPLVKAQTAMDSVKAVINDMFTAMKNGDSTALKNCFAETHVLQSIKIGKDGNVEAVETDELSGFASSISKAPKGSLDERIIFDAIKIDGPLASVWTPYEFYYNGKFLHCGANSFQLLRVKGSQWKIQYLIDTRRKAGCK